jgi:type I restriction enzyme M protein
MDHWAATMQDECYLIAADGWRHAAQPRLIVEEKNKKNKARPDFVLGKRKYQTELIPPALIIQRWFANEKFAIEKLETDLATLQQQMEELVEEHGGEDGAFSECEKINRAEVSALASKVAGHLEKMGFSHLIKES